MPKGQCPRETAQLGIVDGKMLAPRLAYLPGATGVGLGAEQIVQPQSGGACADQRPERIVLADLPIGHQLELNSVSARCMLHLCRSCSLQKRARIGVDECRVDKLLISIDVGRRMPLALIVLAAKGHSVLIRRTARRLVFNPDIIETLRSLFKADLRNDTVRIEQTRCKAPEQARLERRAVAAGSERLRHPLSLSRNGGVGFIPFKISTARA